MGPVIKIVVDSYNLIKDPKKWAQGFYQKDENGKNCQWHEGYSFCALGAIQHFCVDSDTAENSLNNGHKAVCILQRHSEKLFGKQSIQIVNDSTPSSIAHQNVLRIFESVIEKFKDREPTEEEMNEGVWPRSYLKSP